MITYNKPNDKKRMKQQPLQLDEAKHAVDEINGLIEEFEEHNPGGGPNAYESIQKLIYDYENLCHFRSVNYNLWNGK